MHRKGVSMQNCHGHLQIVDQNFKRYSRNRRVHASDADLIQNRENIARRFQCLVGTQANSWKPLLADERKVQIAISYNCETRVFIAKICQHGHTLDLMGLKHHQRRQFTCWIEKSESAITKIPWSRIEAGEFWLAELTFRDFFSFNKRECEIIGTGLIELVSFYPWLQNL
jgi:hypothetical protein